MKLVGDELLNKSFLFYYIKKLTREEKNRDIL